MAEATQTATLRPGVWQIGIFKGFSEMKNRSTGEAYPGFLKVHVAFDDSDTLVSPSPTYNEIDRIDGEPTSMARAVKAVQPKVGERVAVLVSLRGAGQFVNAEARSIIRL